MDYIRIPKHFPFQNQPGNDSDYTSTNTFLALHELPVVALALLEAGVGDVLLFLVVIQPHVFVLLKGAGVPAVPVRGSFPC